MCQIVCECVCFFIQYYKVAEVMIIHKAIFKKKVKKVKKNKIKHPSILFAPYLLHTKHGYEI